MKERGGEGGGEEGLGVEYWDLWLVFWDLWLAHLMEEEVEEEEEFFYHYRERVTLT